MNILHIGHVSDRRQSGVSTVVPKHLKHQSVHENVALLNLLDFKPDLADGIFPVFAHSKYHNVSTLPEPFNAPDLVIFHEVYRPSFIKLSKQLKSMSIPYIIMPHGSLSVAAQKVGRVKKYIANKLILKNFFLGASAIHYGSQYELDNSIKLASSAPSIVLGSGVDLYDTHKVSFNTNGLDIIYIGRLDIHIKGLDLLISAAAIIKDYLRENNIRISIIGPDESDAHAKLITMIDAADMGLSVKVEGPLFGVDKVSRLLLADCFIQLSRTESQCLGLMEAMGIGLPSIATPGTTLYELMDRYSLGFPVLGEPLSIANVIKHVSENRSLLPIVSQKSIAYMSSNYSWEAIGAKTAEAYRGIVG